MHTAQLTQNNNLTTKTFTLLRTLRLAHKIERVQVCRGIKLKGYLDAEAFACISEKVQEKAHKGLVNHTQ